MTIVMNTILTTAYVNMREMIRNLEFSNHLIFSVDVVR